MQHLRISRQRRRIADQRGAAVVEFAIASLLFLGILYGIVTFGVIFMTKNTITHAAEAGARAAIAGGDSLDQEQKAQNRACQVLSGLPSSIQGDVELGTGGACTVPITATGTFDIQGCANDPTVDCITVTVEYPYSAHPVLPALPVFSAALPDVIEHTAVVQLG